MKLVLLSMLLMFLAACTSKPIRYAESGEYKIAKSGNFLISFSPELWKYTNTNRPESSNDVQVLVSNNDMKSHTLYLDKVVAVVNSVKEPLKCHSPQSKGAVIVEPGRVIQVFCEASFQPTDQNKLALKDTYVVFQIPTESAQMIEFERLYRNEDFL